jgi:hypothetical protein
LREAASRTSTTVLHPLEREKSHYQKLQGRHLPEPKIRFACNDKGNEVAYELISDPDQNSNLVAAGKLLTGTGSLGEMLRNCIEAWKLRRPGDQAPAECGSGYKY